MRVPLEKKFVDNTIEEDELALYKKSLWIKKGIILGVYLFMVIFSFIRIYRITIFFNVLGGGGFSFYAVAIVIFYITLFLAFGYFGFQMGYMIYKEIKKEDWVSLITKLNIKIDIYSFLCKCLSILLFIMIYITTPCTVVGKSMETTLQDGDKLLCSDLFFTPKVDDIVVFDAANYTHQDSFYIKRVTAVKGDKISVFIKDKDTNAGVVYINDTECSDISVSEFYKLRESAGISDPSALSFLVPEGMIMVMGDNRNESYDSREFGLIYTADVFGRVYMRLFPISGMHFY